MSVISTQLFQSSTMLMRMFFGVVSLLISLLILIVLISVLNILSTSNHSTHSNVGITHFSHCHVL